MTALRFVGSFLGALVVVSFLLAMGAKLFGMLEPQDATLIFHQVDLLSASDRRDLAGGLGAEPRPGILPPMSNIAPLEFRRSVHGFVQLELSIGSTGQVTAARVLGSTLPPSYEERAIDLVRARRYAPDVVDGQPVASRRLEIVDLRMNAPVGAGSPAPTAPSR